MRRGRSKGRRSHRAPGRESTYTPCPSCLSRVGKSGNERAFFSGAT